MCLECVQLVFSFCLDLKNENSKAPLGPGPALAGLGCALACGGYREFVFRGSLVCGCFVSGSETENRAPQSLHMDLRVCASTGANRSGICPAIFLGDSISTNSFLMLEGLLLGLLGGRIIAFVKLADLTQEVLSPAPSQMVGGIRRSSHTLDAPGGLRIEVHPTCAIQAWFGEVCIYKPQKRTWSLQIRLSKRSWA
jgi:hypothetical protein